MRFFRMLSQRSNSTIISPTNVLQINTVRQSSSQKLSIVLFINLSASSFWFLQFERRLAAARLRGCKSSRTGSSINFSCAICNLSSGIKPFSLSLQPTDRFLSAIHHLTRSVSVVGQRPNTDYLRGAI